MSDFMRYGPNFQYYNPYQRPNFYQNYRPVPPRQNPSHAAQPTSSPKPQKKPEPADAVWLDLFGIKLYFDDVLILSLLFFLYKEEVKDEGLFLALVLLLIS